MESLGQHVYLAMSSVSCKVSSVKLGRRVSVMVTFRVRVESGHRVRVRPGVGWESGLRVKS